MRVSRSRVSVPDVGGEKCDEAPGSTLAGARDRHRQVLKTGAAEVTARNGDDFLAQGRVAN